MNDIVKILLLYSDGERQVKETNICKRRLFGCKLRGYRPVKILVPPGLSKEMRYFLESVVDITIIGSPVTEYF